MIGNLNSIFKQKIKLGGAVVYDADAQAYFTANTAITSAADKTAINDFYLGLKTDGIYTKLNAMYLPIWGSTAACKWNLINPLDTDAAFRLTFTTGWTFTSGGMQGNIVSTYANTFLNNNNLVINDMSFGVYSRTAVSGTYSNVIGADFNTGNPVGYSYLNLGSGNSTYGVRINTSNAEFSNSVIDTKAFYIAQRSGTSSQQLFRNTTKYTNTTAQTFKSVNTFKLGAWIVNGIPYGASQQCSLYFIGKSFTDAEATNFYNRVTTLMTYFGIQN